MSKKELQIVAFNNPYPPDYGGAVDIFYKIKALSALGIKIHIHIYTDKRHDVTGLKPYCASINLYPQKRSYLRHLSLLPFSVNSRRSKSLYENIMSIKAPVLFESLRTCYLLKSKHWEIKTAVRCHNIEHDYSLGLSKSETNFFIKLAHFVEGHKQKWFEQVINNTDVIFSISQYEQSYFSNKFQPKAELVPVFQGFKKINSKRGFGKYALYHGDLTSADNIKSVHFLIDVFADLGLPLVIAGSVINRALKNRVEQHNHIKFEKIVSNEQLRQLIENAQVNTLYSFQRSGTKLKVFTALFNGRHCIINKNMIDDKRILDVCKLAETIDEYRKEVMSTFNEEFHLTKERIKALEAYDDLTNAKLIIEHLL